MALAGDNSASGEGLARVQALDLLRLVAVLGVVLFHYGFRGPTALGTTFVAVPDIVWIARYGYLGVQIFFVISGFVIAYSAQGRTAIAFVIARFARIYPTFLFCMTITFFATATFGKPYFESTFTQWTANLFIVAPMLSQPYMDSAYWSLVVEVMFYAWVTAFIVAGLFPRRINTVILLWLSVSLLNGLTVDSHALDKILLTDNSGFFATGILIYELHRGRRDPALQCLLAMSIATAVFQAVHNLSSLRAQTDSPFDDWIVAAVCLASILTIIRATRIQRLPLPPRVVIAFGALTYPLYLLHQQLGYVVFKWIGPVSHPSVLAALIIFAIALLSLLTWRYFERPCQRFTKQKLTDIFAFLDWFPKRIIGRIQGPTRPSRTSR